MKTPKLFIALAYLLFFFAPDMGHAQGTRFDVLEKRLNDLAILSPGLNEVVDFSVSGASIQEFLRGLAESHNLNISIDPQLTIQVYNNFTNEKVSNILLFLAREYDLDIRFTGTILSFTRYVAPAQPKVVIPTREILVSYNAYANLLSLDLREDTLSNVVKKITQVAKKNVIHAPGLANKKISVYLGETLFDNALDKLAYANSLKVIKTDDGAYLLRELDEGEEAIVNVTKTKTRRPAKLTSSGQNQASLFYEVITDSAGKKLVSLEAVNAPIGDIVKGISEELGISYFLFSDIKGSTTTNVYRVHYDEILTYLLQGTDYTFKFDQGLYLIGERKLEGLRASKVYQFRYRSLADIQEIIPAEIRKNVEIKEFKELNSILLTGSVPQIEEIEAFITQLDKVVPMVLIEVIMLDIRKGKSVKTEVRAGLSDSVKTGGTFLPGLDFTAGSQSINKFLSELGGFNPINLGKVSPSFYVGLSAMEQNSNVHVRSMPKLSTLNGHDANLSIGSTRYYVTTTQNVLGSLNPQTVVTQQFNAVQANLTITINPVVSGDDQVTLNIDVNISDFIGDPPLNSPPPSATSQFKSIIRVKNEEMVVLGGIERTEQVDSGSGVPLLARVPLLKWLFSSRSKSNNKIVSVVFIKPTILY